MDGDPGLVKIRLGDKEKSFGLADAKDAAWLKVSVKPSETPH